MFSNTKVVYYLRKNSLELYYGDLSEKLEFPASAFSNLEIQNLDSYKKLISEFLNKLDLKGQKALVVLSGEVIFSKIIPLDSTNTTQTKVQQFIDSIPFPSDKVVFKTLNNETETLVLATNKELYSELISLLASFNLTVKAVVPLNVFKPSLNLISDNIDPQIAKKILEEKKLIEATDFLLNFEGQAVKQTKTYPLTLLLLIGLIIIVAAALLMASTFGFLKIPLEYLPKAEEQLVQESPKPQEGISSATEDKPTLTSKEGLTAQVLNGSGITGQAAKVKTQLEGLGFTDIETGNATGASATDTVVFFSDKVPSEIKNEVKLELEKVYTEVTIQVATVFQFDILVTTGTDLAE